MKIQADFIHQLRRVEFLAAILTEYLTAGSARDLIGEKSAELITPMVCLLVCLFDCALTYFGHSYFGRTMCCY